MPEEATTETATQEAPQQQDAPQQTQESQASSSEELWINPDGSFKEGWIEKLVPEKYWDREPTLSRHKSIGSLAQSLLEKESFIGKLSQNKGNLIEVPRDLPEGATEDQIQAHNEAMAKYRQSLGVPETPDGYDVKPPKEALPEGLEWKDEMVKPFLEIAHRNNIPPKAMREMTQAFIQNQVAERQAMVDAQNKAAAENDARLQDEWRGNFKENMEYVDRALSMLGYDPNDPNAITKALSRVGRQFSEDTAGINGHMVPRIEGPAWARAVQLGADPNLSSETQRYRNGDEDMVRRVHTAAARK